MQIKQRFANLRKMITTSWKHWKTLKIFEKGKMVRNKIIRFLLFPLVCFL